MHMQLELITITNAIVKSEEGEGISDDPLSGYISYT